MAAKRPAPKAPAALHGELSGRLRDLFAKTVKPGPYEVTDTISVPPPSRGMWAKLDELKNTAMAARFLHAELWQRIGTEQAPSTDDLTEVAEAAKAAEDEYDRLFFGEHLPKIKSLSADWQPGDWRAFCDDIKNYFLGTGPATGSCPHCGHVVDEEQAGKAPTSST